MMADGWHPPILTAPRKALEPISFLWHLTQNKTNVHVLRDWKADIVFATFQAAGKCFAQLRGISMALLLAQNGDCAGRDGGE